jgi:hypothetical protein
MADRDVWEQPVQAALLGLMGRQSFRQVINVQLSSENAGKLYLLA